MILTTVSVLAAVAVAMAGHPAGFYNGQPTPPRRFRGGATAIVTTMSPADVNATCSKLLGPPEPGHTWLGCTNREANGEAHVYGPTFCSLPNSGPYCHEWGHVNGWPATHGS